MRFFLPLLVAILVALITGFGLTYYALADGRLFGAYRFGSWGAWPNVGAPAPDPYSRAVIARSGRLQLGRGEGVQFTASYDRAGHRLTRNCTYRVEGSTPVATFWTLRAVDTNGANIALDDAPRAFSSTRLARDAEGRAVVHIGPALRPGQWMHIGGGGDFNLILTFYDASVFAGFGTTIAEMPEIIAEGCQ